MAKGKAKDCMDLTQPFEKLVSRFEAYYDVHREDVTPPFDAEAEFHSHDAQFFLVRSATISEAESHEYVYFAKRDVLDEDALRAMDEKAWEEGLAHVTPHKDHRNSDVSLIILANEITEGAAALVPKLRHYKSYQFSLQGWSQYRLIAVESSTGRIVFNRQGKDLKKLISDIF
ncbi:MAG: hypothetical protein LUG56_10645 [Lachnospiraceae bacterium]|nr:hypothetical protein [Lachnospiraceae bacterium]